VRNSIKRQIEYYFGDKNYPRDRFLQEQVKLRNDGYVALSKIMNFNRMKALTNSKEQVLKAIEGSDVVEVSQDGQLVRKKGIH